jgi:hypothetical protein
MNPKTVKIARYLGLGAAILVPALVVAQQQVNPPTVPFADNDILRASEVRQLRNALVEAIARINSLEQNAGPALTKANVYSIEGRSEPIPANSAEALAQVRCVGESDILLTCGCQGLLEGINSPQFELRRVDAIQNPNDASECVCQAENVGTNVARVLVARGSCLTVP